MDLITSFMGRGGLLPHGYCFTWSPGLLWTMVGSDALIAAAYFSIPLAIVSFVRQRADSVMNGVPWLFSAFIFACGVTHVMDIWTVWQPDYGVQALTKITTAAISIVTAVALWRLMPKALSIPSVGRLQAVIASLEAEVQKRRTAEDHLAETQQSLAVTLATIGAGFIATDREGRVTHMNAVAEQLLGVTEAQAHGQIIWDVFVREGRPPEYAAMNPVDVMIHQGVTVDTAHRVVAIARDGSRTALEVKAALTHARDGSVRGLAMVFRDVTRQLSAETESNRLAALVESSYDAIISKTLDGHITSWNAAAEGLFGYTADEAIGQSIQMLIPPERAVEEMRVLTDLARGIRVPAFDTVRRAKDGSLLEVSITISPIRDGEGRIVGASKIARDVARQRRAEAALLESEAKLRFTLESAQIGDWDLDLKSGVVHRSLRHDRCFGYTELLAEWRFETFVQHVHPDDRAEVARTFHAAVAERKGWNVECRVIWPAGSVHWISAQGSIVQHNGEPVRMLGIVTDITQQKLAEEARVKSQRLEAENRQIQEANRLKSLFLANMSHELRTPLNAIIGFADLLQSGAVPAESPKHAQFMGHIGVSGRHLLQLINDVLDLSKVESGKFEFFPEPTELPLLVKEVRDILHTSIERNHIHFVTDLDPALTGLVLDPARLKQVLYNYLSNAIKFTPDGGHITVRARAEGPDHLRLEVQDDGIGIAEADLPRLFTEFQQLDSGYSKQHQGTGLGLALTRRLVQAQGGSVGVRSRLGQGSVFHLVLRRVQGDLGRAAAGLPADTVTPGGQRMLVIEDNLQLRTRLSKALAEAGFTVDAVDTGALALKHALDNAYDGITIDLMLPDWGGLGVLATIRNQGPSSDSPVVGVTMPVNVDASAVFAVADVLGKPIRTEEVVAAMARFRLVDPRRANVMVIDDDPMALDLMRATLRGIGINTVCLLDGREALRDIERHRPDAIILDLMMPGFDGFAVLDALHRMPGWRDTPVYIWTSMILTEEEFAHLARTARAILSKGGGELTAMLESLRRRRPRVEMPSGLSEP